MNVKTILREYLVAKGYDGLSLDCGVCGCELDDLMGCDEAAENCRPAYRVPCNANTCPWGKTSGTHGYHMLPGQRQ